MTVSEMIAKLSIMQEKHGDLELLIVDGFNAVCYRGDYKVGFFSDENDVKSIDIGIGGLDIDNA
jgi:hypothetical protein